MARRGKGRDGFAPRRNATARGLTAWRSDGFAWKSEGRALRNKAMESKRVKTTSEGLVLH
nr:MAG TPA: hypothetical protein [Caudoviricetes sp.]